jgi:protein ImuA
MLGSFRQKAIVQPQAAVLAQLREKLNCLEGTQRLAARTAPICDIINDALPYRGLPLGCVHEVKGAGLASAIAFAALLTHQIPQNGPVLYVAPDRSFYPLGFTTSGVNFEQWIHISARRSKDLSWTVLEAMRCSQVKVVLAIMTSADLTFCRRLQLAAESSGATGFLIHHAAAAGSIASAITRWHVSPEKGAAGRGLGDTFWRLELQYCRGGRPGKWVVTLRNNKLELLSSLSEAPPRPVQRVTLAQETALAG